MSSFYSSMNNLGYYNTESCLREKELERFSEYVKKHPVTHLYDYCRFWCIRPKFTFTELQQLSGVEFICNVRVENYFGEGRAFNKKTSKALAAANLLERLIYDEDEECHKRPERYVSQTFSVSLVMDCSTRRAQAERSSDSEVENDVEPTEENSNTEEFRVKVEDSNNEEILTMNHVNNYYHPLNREKFEDTRDPVDNMEVDSQSEDNQENNGNLLQEINNFCNTNSANEDEVSTPKSSEMPNGSTEDIKIHPDAAEYLKKCCIERNMEMPVYRGCITNGRYVSKCYIAEKMTYGKGETLSEAKNLAANFMIEHFKW